MRRILALTGGVGGAKLALGLSRVLEAHEVLFAVNTADDFTHLGLHISPDIDSLTYALAGQNNTETGWGRAGDSWHCIETFAELGGADWFRLGDKDLALHLRRTQLMAAGGTLTDATASIAQALGIAHPIAPMSNDAVRTIVHTDSGPLAFQHYFVRERCAPRVERFEFRGGDTAELNPLIESWLDGCDGVVICPSNPYVSIDPMLSLGRLRERLTDLPVVAISPIVGGLALKGPAAKMMAELHVPATVEAVAAHYHDILDGLVIDSTDAEASKLIGIPTIVTNTIMVTLADRVALASAALGFLGDLTPAS